MKKLITVVGILCAGIMAHGACVWNFTTQSPVVGVDGKGTYNGSMTVYAFAKDAAFDVATAVASWDVTALSGEFTVTDQTYLSGGSDVFAADTTYSFYLYAKSDSSEYVGTKTNGKATAVGSRTVTLKAGEWTGSVPEPTSGLMLAIGMGLMALRRRRA